MFRATRRDRGSLSAFLGPIIEKIRDLGDQNARPNAYLHETDLASSFETLHLDLFLVNAWSLREWEELHSSTVTGSASRGAGPSPCRVSRSRSDLQCNLLC